MTDFDGQGEEIKSGRRGESTARRWYRRVALVVLALAVADAFWRGERVMGGLLAAVLVAALIGYGACRRGDE
ncbi:MULTISPECIES: hypothetical protein [Jonquetella]|uniref:Uncharacterized protein n=1 Tax=Jonquetella anthropi DSM 22815 TaxID=885272 RepID=H0ULK4_9BACT|nr:MULTISPECIES: hypothetical protein [Jonquetella]EEX49209.1 hypothetical protein GCWU000246_00295 [Jonquetella anthropi E3_33 E1]EHM12469.1 hypothetical protein JonanDRAFT_0032 [Jonquetella anthropi DSM 22815]ERL24828.1 hypothetical protein HMPREF1249_0731 [Jonquetella sp. BV3C21]